ncbi:type VI secretion system Vgr family protein [Pseudochrobactrum sp. HB0163]|uniref:type VI secretion system Vgr family protein n=1 Tax=Pseudochrobactrum sp. HB0163 TaxID=3450708 RepID=UPI003F6DDE87
MSAVQQDDYSAKDRCLRLEIAAIAGEIHADQAEITEQVNNLYCADVTFSCDEDIVPQEIIGSKAEIIFACAVAGEKNTTCRSLDGIITKIRMLSASGQGGRQYSVQLRPALWRLGQVPDYRIWQHMSAVDVAETLTREYNLPAVDFRIRQPPQIIDYSVQYGETDLDYLFRRLEQAGLFWWFRREKEQHILCVGDRASSWMPAREWQDGAAGFFLSEKRDNRRDGQEYIQQEHIYEWQETFCFVPPSHSGADWNFEMPDAAVAAQVPSLVTCTDFTDKGIFAYPAGAHTAEQVEQLQKLRMLADEARHCVVCGKSAIHLLAPARIFTPLLPRGGQLPDYVITGVTHHISVASSVSGRQSPHYHNSFTAVPADIALIPQLAHPAPRCAATQIAIVAGPKQEEIYCDKYGRVKLWFPWDRRAKKDGSDTCWVRVAQIWNGAGYGAEIIPRVGAEVAVSFLNADPDHPVIIASLVNPKAMPAYKLPDFKTRLTIRSRTYKGEGFNEIFFEDAAGKENFSTIAQKERTEIVGGSRHSKIAKDYISNIGGDHIYSVNGNYRVETSASTHMAVGAQGAEAEKILAKLSPFNSKTACLLDQGAGLASGVGRDGLKALAKALRSGKLGFIPQKREQKQSSFSENGLAEKGESGLGIQDETGSAFQGKGEHHTLISRLRSATVGHACVDQIAGGKVLHVGGVYLNHIAEEQITTVGKKLTMLSGEVTDIESKKIELFADNAIRLSAPGGYIELNKSGIILHGLKIDIQGNHVDFQQGGAGEGTRKTLPES